MTGSSPITTTIGIVVVAALAAAVVALGLSVCGETLCNGLAWAARQSRAIDLVPDAARIPNPPLIIDAPPITGAEPPIGQDHLGQVGASKVAGHECSRSHDELAFAGFSNGAMGGNCDRAAPWSSEQALGNALAA